MTSLASLERSPTATCSWASGRRNSASAANGSSRPTRSRPQTDVRGRGAHDYRSGLRACGRDRRVSAARRLGVQAPMRMQPCVAPCDWLGGLRVPPLPIFGQPICRSNSELGLWHERSSCCRTSERTPIIDPCQSRLAEPAYCLLVSSSRAAPRSWNQRCRSSRACCINLDVREDKRDRPRRLVRLRHSGMMSRYASQTKPRRTDWRCGHGPLRLSYRQRVRSRDSRTTATERR